MVTGALRQAVDAQLVADATFAQREAVGLAPTNDATRQFLQDDLEAIAARDAAQVKWRGLFQRHEPGTIHAAPRCAAAAGGPAWRQWDHRGGL
jgi:hypothetical protein